MITGLLLVAFQNCGPGPDGMRANQPAENQSPDLQSRFKTLNDLAAADLSCAGDGDCVALPIGHRPCGGPADYIVTSFRNSQFDQIDALANEVTELQRQYNTEHQLAGTCDFRMAPTLQCLQSQCVKN